MVLERQFKQELLELDRKYAALYAPIFERRASVIAGARNPTPPKPDEGQLQIAQIDPETAPDESQDEDGVPFFWVKVLSSRAETYNIITEQDREALLYLKDIQVDILPFKTPGFKLSFRFGSNPFFANHTLPKIYHYEDEIDYSDNYAYSTVEGTVIQWKDRWDLTKMAIPEMEKSEDVLTKPLPTSNNYFFNFLTTPATSLDPKADEAPEELEESVKLDRLIAEVLKRKVIPHAIDYYTGLSMEYDTSMTVENEEWGDEEDGTGGKRGGRPSWLDESDEDTEGSSL